MKIVSWKLIAYLDDGTEKNVSDCPSYVDSAVDEYLTELEEKENGNE